VIIDSSALIAILRHEDDAARYALAVEAASVRRLSAANFFETAMVVDGSRDPIASRRLDDLLRIADIRIEPVTEQQVRIAREAYRDFGKGNGHPAQLNFGDCFAYALAKVSGEALLYKGDDFSHTDVASADASQG
jgi:ribonuclease VapC